MYFLHTVNVEIFSQYIFSRISRSALDARKYDVSEKMKHYRSNRINYKMRENLSTRKWLDARKFSCAKISTFTVVSFPHNTHFRVFCASYMHGQLIRAKIVIDHNLLNRSANN